MDREQMNLHDKRNRPSSSEFGMDRDARSACRKKYTKYNIYIYNLENKKLYI